jgi:phosphoribosylformylglycinamidine synthase
MNVAVVVFPGTNCDYDTKWAFEKIGADVSFVWYKESKLPQNIDLVVLPGGFSYGDYLRSGAIARFSPIMDSIINYANSGGLTLGICNGFQILLEANLLPGAIKRNKNLHFISRFQYLKVVDNNNLFLQYKDVGSLINIPVAHADGSYYIDDIETLKQNGQILLQYADSNGDAVNINGAVESIAGICNINKNVFGLMPHPERAMDTILGSDDGIDMLKGLLKG